MRSSIRRRIFLVLLLAQGALTATAASAIVLYVHRQMLAAFDSELHRRMVTALAMVQTADEQSAGVVFDDKPNSLPADDLYVVSSPGGAVIAASPHSRGSFDTIGRSRQATYFDIRGRRYRGEVWRSVPVLDEEDEGADDKARRIDLAYAIPTDALSAGLVRIATMAIIGSCLFLTISTVAAWVSVSKGLAPLNELAIQASRISDRFWTFRPARDVLNVSELRPLAKALEDLISRLERAFDRERTFVGDAAHELKTVVAIQKSTLQVTAHGPEDIIEYHRGLERALLDVERMETLVLRMLSLASVEGSPDQQTFAPVPLEETLYSACEQLESLAALRGIRIQTDEMLCCSICGDAELMKTLWTALLENAIQHSSPGSCVTLKCVAVNANACRVTIQDHGEGISPKDLPRVFDRFYRADRSRSRETGGHGLGLSISKAIVERHHGEIVIESTYGRGTTVNVEFPRSAEAPY
jgi:signal transduction histidine kinase